MNRVSRALNPAYTPDSPIVLSVDCEERFKVGYEDGKSVYEDKIITRHVRELSFTRDALMVLFDRAKQFKTIFSEEITNDFGKFVNILLNQNSDGSVSARGLFWVIDDFVGIFYLTEIKPGVDGIMHYSFFDGRHKGRVKLAKEMIKYAFEQYKFRRLTTEVPMYATESVHNFVQHHIGLRNEGRKRKAILFNNEWFDLKLYGILKEETEIDGWST